MDSKKIQSLLDTSDPRKVKLRTLLFGGAFIILLLLAIALTLSEGLELPEFLEPEEPGELEEETPVDEIVPDEMPEEIPVEEFIPECEEGDERSCEVNGCPGTQTCYNGEWGECYQKEKVCMPGTRRGCAIDNCNFGYAVCNECGTGYGPCMPE